MLSVKSAVNTISALFLLSTAASTTGKTLPTKGEGKDDYDICDSPVCMQRAMMIKTSIDLCVDPCEDFYSYACGDWTRNHTIPESKSSLASFDILRNELNEDLRRILENMPVVNADEQKATDKVTLAYKACLAVPEAGDQYKALWDIMNEYGLAQWPLLAEEQQRRAKDLNWTDVLLNVGFSPVLALGVERSNKNSTTRIIALDQITFESVGRNELIHPNKRNSQPIIAAYKKLIAASAMFFKPTITELQAKILANDLVDFEGKLANITKPPEERRDIMALLHETTIGDLERNVSGFPLLKLLQKEFNKVNVTLDEAEAVVLYAMDYYRKMPTFFSEADPAAVFNYFGLKVMLAWADHASEKIRNASFELQKAVYGVKKPTPRWETCVHLLNNQMKEVIGYLYVTKKLHKDAKIEVKEMIEAVKDAFNETLQSVTWMDADTRREATMKLQRMKSRIGYPDWLLNTTYLEEFYKYMPRLNHSSPFVSVRKSIHENDWKTTLGALRMPYDPDKTWVTGAAVVNAFYSERNEIVFPAGILQGVFYQLGLPRSLNFGAIGYVAGHEVTHGFDDMGSQYDAEGQLRQWWTEGTREEFKNKSQCFVQQYGRIYEKDAGMKLNGINTVGENIADNGGLRAAFKAYKKFLQEKAKGKDTRLRGLEELSGEKLFFIAHATIWCSLYRPELLRSLIQYGTHSPGKYRVNVVMANMAEFSTVWNCPAYSPMNPDRSETCSLW